MRGFLDKRSKDSGVDDEHSHAAKIDTEENWGRMRFSWGTGLGSRFAETFCPIARVLSWLGRRASFDWQRPRQQPRQELETFSITNPATAVTEVISSYVADLSDLPSVTSIVQLPASSTLQIAVTTSVPSTTQNLSIIGSHQHHSTAYNLRNDTVIVSTISNPATNGTSGYLTTTPITATASGSSVIYSHTTLPAPKRTSLTVKTWTNTKTTSQGMNTTTTWKTSTTAITTTAITTTAITTTFTNTTTNTTTNLRTSSDETTSTSISASSDINITSTSSISASSDITTTSTSSISTTTILFYYPNPQPQPTTEIYATPLPTNSGTETDNTPTVGPQVVGGIVGGVAGLALVILVIFMLLKRYRRQQAIQALNDAGYGGPLVSPSMVQRSISFLGGARYRAAPSGAMDVGPVERGFVKVSGRKLPPAIGGPRPEFGSMRSNAQSSHYTGDDSGIGASGTSHGPARYSSSATQAFNPFASPPSSPTNVGSSRRGDNTDGDSIEEIRILPRSPPSRPIYNRQLSLVSDGVGRSHASHDGSRGSRFTEDIT